MRFKTFFTCVLIGLFALPLCSNAQQARSKLLGRVIQLPPDRPLNVTTHCSFSNETGYKGESVVDVREGKVKELSTIIDVPELGRCEFNLDGMVQVKSVPMVELRHPKTGCTVRMWEQGPKATVSFTECNSHCANPEAFRYVWPVLINRATAHCD